MEKSKFNEIDCMILSSIINSDESYEDILLMVGRFCNMRDYLNHLYSSNIQNPCPVGDKTDILKEV